MKSLAAGLAITGWHGATAWVLGLEWPAARQAGAGQAQEEWDRWHRGLLPGWQQSQWQADMPHRDEAW